MKRFALAMFLLVFAGISLAETPKIVDPPKPIRHFKKILIVESLGDARIIVHDKLLWPSKFFIYLNDYEIREDTRPTCQQSFILPKPRGDVQVFSDDGKDMTEFYQYSFLLYSKNCPIITGNIDESNTVFLEAVLPKQSAKASYPFKWIHNRKADYRPQKAKVIFTK